MSGDGEKKVAIRELPDWNGIAIRDFLRTKGIDAEVEEFDGANSFKQETIAFPDDPHVHALIDAWLGGYRVGWS